MNPAPQERPFTNQDQPTQDGLFVDWIDEKPVLLDFEGGRLSSDAGLLLLGQLDAHLALTHAMASVLHDERDPKRIRHSMTDLLRQRVLQIAAGYEDQDDSDTLRSDPIFKMLLGRAPPAGADLASQPTMSRFENGITSYELDQLVTVFLEAFLGSYDEAPEVIVLDFDDTADLAHGEQEQARFNAHVGGTCFMPLHVYEGLSGRLILTLLKPSLLYRPATDSPTSCDQAAEGLASDRDPIPGRQSFHLPRGDGLPRVSILFALCDWVGHQ